MFSLRDFIYNGLVSAIGNLNDYQIILNAAGWHEKGVLTEEDLITLQGLIEEKNNKPKVEEELTEDVIIAE